MTRINLPTKATEDCPNCRTTHILTIEHDEDGGYVQIDVTPCHADDCTKQLCSACPQFKCGICELTFCAEHGTKQANGDTICQVCAEILRVEAIREESNSMRGFTPAQAQRIVEHAMPPETTITDQEEIETYICGPDDPEAYFAKFSNESELMADFKQFLDGYERG